MRWVIKQNDLDQMKAKHGSPDSVVGYADEFKILAIPVPKMYVVIIDDRQIKLIQLTMNMEEKNIETIPISSVQEVKVSGVAVKKVVLTTPTGKVKLSVKPLAVGIQDSQKALLDKFKTLK